MSVPAYPEYRESGIPHIGPAPKAWQVTRLRFVSEFNPSKSEVSHLAPDMEAAFLPMDAIGEDGSLQLDARRELATVQQGYTYFREGDVVIAKITPCFENGKGAFLKGLPGGFGFGTTELIVVRPRLGRVLGEYLHWLFVSPDFRVNATAAMHGAGGQKRVPDEFVRDFAIALPSIAEQSAITAFLDRETGKIDALVAEQERLMALLKEKRQAVISQAVTKGLNPNAPMKDSGVEWLGEVPAQWELTRVKHLAKIISKGTTPTTVGGEFTDFGVRFIKAENISDGEVSQTPEFFIDEDTHQTLSRSSLEESDILIVIAGATTGKSAIIPASFLPANTNQAVCFIRCRNPELASYLNLWLSIQGVQRSITQSAVQSAQPNLSMEDLGNLPIALPPDEDRKQITHVLSEHVQQINALTFQAELAIALLKERRAALISAAVTGKIDVRGLVEREAAA